MFIVGLPEYCFAASIASRSVLPPCILHRLRADHLTC